LYDELYEIGIQYYNFEYCKWMGVYGEFKLDVNVWVILLPIDLMLKLTIAIRAVVLDGI